VRIGTEILAEIRPDERIGRVVANDSGRSSFTAVCGDGQDRLVALDPDLRELARWRIGHGLVIHRLDGPADGWLVGGLGNTWFAATSAGFRRYQLAGS
jgi:hypothetical protein